MARNILQFENGTLVSKAKVEVGGTIYEVEPEEYEGTTPLSAENLNELQNRICDYADEKIKNEYSTTQDNTYSCDYINKNAISISDYTTGNRTITATGWQEVPSKTVDLITKGRNIIVSFSLMINSSGGSPKIGVMVDNEVKFDITDSMTNDHINSHTACISDIPAGNHTIKLVVNRGNAGAVYLGAYTSSTLTAFEI